MSFDNCITANPEVASSDVNIGPWRLNISHGSKSLFAYQRYLFDTAVGVMVVSLYAGGLTEIVDHNSDSRSW